MRLRCHGLAYLLDRHGDTSGRPRLVGEAPHVHSPFLCDTRAAVPRVPPKEGAVTMPRVLGTNRQPGTTRAVLTERTHKVGGRRSHVQVHTHPELARCRLRKQLCRQCDREAHAAVGSWRFGVKGEAKVHHRRGHGGRVRVRGRHEPRSNRRHSHA
eukprot:scaffold197248_cov30-Tisochrysis_lutea.AAC.5